MKVTPEQFQTIKDLCEKGYSEKYIADIFHVGRSTINRFIKEYNIIKGVPRKKEYPIDDIKNDFLNSELTKYEICKKYHIHTITLDKILGELKNQKNTRIKKQPKNKKITKELLQDLINKKLTYKEMTSKTGLSETNLKKWISRWNLIKPKKVPYEQRKGYLKLTEENLREYYINQNIPDKELPKYFGYSLSTIHRFLSKFNIKKTQELKNKIREKTCTDKYGVKNISKTFEIKEKVKQTNLKKFGNTCSLQAKTIKEKSLNTIRLKANNPNLINISQRNISPEILQLMHDKEALKDYIIQNNISSPTELAHKLNLSNAGCIKIIHKFDLDYLKTYSQSSPEKELRDYIQQYFITECNTKKYLNHKYEIDIYIPEKKIGIEFNGNWWHSEKKVSKNYHIMKSKLAENDGIFLYHVFEYEWQTKKEQIINQLNNLLGLNTQKIYARKCNIKEITTQEKNIFLNKNHLQGEDKSNIKLGLYFNNELVSVMTFTKSRFNKKYQWELSRFCSKSNTTVIGGASKLFKYFITHYNPKTIISYSNNAHTKGLIYKTLGFEFIKNSIPNYVWFKYTKTLSRYQCQKHKLLQQGFSGNSETEIMHNRKFVRIYDCGNKVWLWKKPTTLKDIGSLFELYYEHNLCETI